MLKLSLLVLCFLIGTSLAKEVTRSKRQMNVYYMCGNYPNSFVSQYPCTTAGNGCGYNSCNGFSSTGILPNSFYYPSNNCNSGCSNLNCNQYNGIQYVAYSYGSNQYSPCASSCCGNNNNFFGGRVIAVPFGGFNNGFNFGNGLNIGSGVYPTGSLDNELFSVPIGSGVYPNTINAGPTGQTITVGGPLGATGQTINVGGPLAKQ